MQNSHKVFLSFAKEDLSVAEAMCKYLENESGIKCWYYSRDQISGIAWQEQIVKSIDESKIFVLILSHNANKSQDVMNEVCIASRPQSKSQNHFVVPYRIDDISSDNLNHILRYNISKLHWFNATTRSQEDCFAEFSEQISSYLNSEVSDTYNNPNYGGKLKREKNHNSSGPRIRISKEINFSMGVNNWEKGPVSDLTDYIIAKLLAGVSNLPTGLAVVVHLLFFFIVFPVYFLFSPFKLEANKMGFRWGFRVPLIVIIIILLRLWRHS